jgi:signal transduction histidine kinase/ligand-binding sensor domain-containing protein
MCALRKFVFLSAMVLLTWPSSEPSFAQTAETGALTGTISDMTRALLHGVIVHLTEESTGQTRVAVSQDDGRFAFALQSATVNSAPTMLQTESSTLGGAVDGQEVTSLPLVTRNYTQIMGLSQRTEAPVTNATDLRRGNGGLSPTQGTSSKLSLDVSQYAHTSWKISDGFFKGAIHSIAQTPDGYLWLGTEFGLLRFDGVQTVPWLPPAGEHLPSNDIRSLIAASDGTLWLGTAKGLVSWKSGTLNHYPEFDKHDVHTLLQDREGTVWAAGSIWEAGPSQAGKTALCAIKRGRTECYGRDDSLGFYGVTSAYEDSHGNLWLGAANGVWHWKPGPPKCYPMPELKHYGLAGFLFGWRGFLETDDGALLIAIIGSEGIIRFDNGKVQSYQVPPFRPRFHEGGGLLRDRDGGLWIGTEAGLLHVHRGRIDVFDQSDGLSSNWVENMFEDREGNIWITTRSGLDRFREYAVPSVSVKQGLSTAIARSVLAAKDGSVWLATTNGLNRWKDGQVTVYRNQPTGARRQIGGTTAEGEQGHGSNHSRETQQTTLREMPAAGLPDNEVGSLYEEPQGRLWISTARGLAYFENGKFTPLPQVHIPSFSESPIARDSDGNLWMTGDQGLCRLSSGHAAKCLAPEKLGLRGLLSTLVPDPKRGGLWVGSWESGVVYFKNGKVRESYGPETGLGSGRVNALQFGSENTLWAATDGGLSRIIDSRVATLTSKNGLPCDTAHAVVEDDFHSLWLYMACGLVRIERPEMDAWVADPHRRIKVRLFDTSDGVKSHAGVLNYAPRITKAPDGKLWFVPLDGVSVIDPRNLAFNSIPPAVHIEQITSDRKSYEASSGMRLPALVRDLWIDYTALSFRAPEKVRFRFKLEGQDRDWREVVNDRQVQYSNLAPGTYRFRVIACNNSGVWNEAGTFLDFSIAPAYWQTDWFRALCVLLFMAMLWMLYRMWLRQVAHRFNLRMEERVNERTRVARDLHDTLLQSFQGLMLRFQAVYRMLPTCPDDAREILGSAIGEAAQAITEGRDAIQGLRTSTVQSNNLAFAVRTLGEELASAQAAPNPARFQVAVEGTPRNLHPVLRDEVYRIAAEALRNAFKHAQAHQIEVDLCYNEQQLQVRVRDDGKGIDGTVLDGNGSEGHFGLYGMRERAELIGGKLHLWSELDAGTEVELSIPASNAYERPGVGRRPWSIKLAGKITCKNAERNP